MTRLGAWVILGLLSWTVLGMFVWVVVTVGLPWWWWLLAAGGLFVCVWPWRES